LSAKKKSAAPGTGRFAYEGLDRAIHEKARLGILTSLAAHPEGLLFNDLKELCSLTDGNLNRHLAVLEEAELVATQRATSPGREQGRVQTTVAMTRSGRRKFQEYLNVLEQVLSDAASRQAVPAPRGQRRSGISPA
jgi:DNA-binding transcriptional ArsR family regulator